MAWIRTVVRELMGLVVDDVGFAAAVVAWIGLVWLLASYGPAKSAWLSPLLFVGLGAILLHGVAKRAGRAGQ